MMTKKLSHLNNSFGFTCKVIIIFLWLSSCKTENIWMRYRVEYPIENADLYVASLGRRIERGEKIYSLDDKRLGEPNYSYNQYKKNFIRKKDAIYRLYKQETGDTLVAYYPLRDTIFRGYTYSGLGQNYRFGLVEVLYSRYDTLPANNKFNANGLQVSYLGKEKITVNKKRYNCYHFKEQPTLDCIEGLKTYTENILYVYTSSPKAIYYATVELWVDQKTLIPIKQKIIVYALNLEEVDPANLLFATAYFEAFRKK
jgi:hypothetical protein